MWSDSGEHQVEKGPRLGVSDQPIEGRRDDWLSLSNEACALAEFVSRCVTPLTIAVQGDWGSGKTSLLRMIEEQLKSGAVASGASQKIKVIRFETWQYAQFGGGPSLPLSLLSMLARRLSPPGKLAPIANTLQRLARPAANAALRMATAGSLQIEDNPLAPSGVDFAQECDRLRRELERAVQDKLNDGIERIVVMIDDLDRIEPSLAIDILQTIKMFLDLEHCVFILALDFAVVKDGVQAKFGIKDERKARAFFDKIIQLPFQVPVAKYDVGGFIRHMLANLGEPGLDGNEANALEALSRASITSNPRAIKRVMNSLHLTRIIAQDTFERLGNRRAAGVVALFGLLCLQTRFPEAYAWLLAKEDASAALQQLDQATPEELPPLLDTIAFTDTRDCDDFAAFAKLMVAHAETLAGNFAKVLEVTRSTSVGEQQTAYRFSADIHADNKIVMESVLGACRRALPDVAVTIANVGHREGIRLSAEPQPGVMLSLEHSKSWLGLSVETAAAKQESVLAVLPTAKAATDGTIHVWNVVVHDTTPMWRRQEQLREAPEYFAAAWHALSAAVLVR